MDRDQADDDHDGRFNDGDRVMLTDTYMISGQIADENYTRHVPIGSTGTVTAAVPDSDGDIHVNWDGDPVGVGTSWIKETSLSPAAALPDLTDLDDIERFLNE